MSSSQSHNWWRASVLGALNGVIFGAIAEIIRERRCESQMRLIEESFRSSGMTPPLMADLLRWYAIPLWATIFFIIASLLVHRFLAARLKWPLLIWEAVGIAGASAWLFFWQTVGRIGGPPAGHGTLFSSSPPGDWVVCLLLAAAVNLLYGTTIQLSLPLYGKKFS